MSRFSFKKTAILVIILALPGFLYYLLQEKGKNRYHPLPVFGPKEAASTFHSVRGRQIPDTIYHRVNRFSLVNQNADTVDFYADTVKISIVNFFYTRCGENCDEILKEMARVRDRFKDNKLLRFISISVDPEDKPNALQDYAAKYAAEAPQWNFLSGDTAVVYPAARQGFLVDALNDSTKTGNFIYSPLIILIDPQKRIRGYYNPKVKEERDKLMDEIKVLIVEELRKVKE